MPKVKVPGRKPVPGKHSAENGSAYVYHPIPEDGEEGSAYRWYGCGPRLERMTTWVPERWEAKKDPLLAGLEPASRESWRFHTWLDRGYPSLRDAYYCALRLARGNLTFGNFLVLAGPTGTGKTHLAAAIGWEWFEDGFRVVFTRVDDLLDDLRKGYDDNTYHKKLDRVRYCDLLILDDLGTEAARDWGLEKLDRVVDWRYAARVPLVVTTNAKSEDLLPRVASRLGDKSCSVVVQIDAPDARPELGVWERAHE